MPGWIFLLIDFGMIGALVLAPLLHWWFDVRG
jgi:hypothetical protein